MGKTNHVKLNNDIHKDFRRMSLAVLAAMAAIALILTTIITEVSNNAIRTTAVRLISANNIQLQMNIDSYFEKVESTSALLFSDEKYYKYDASNKKLDPYEKITKEEEISSRIVDLGIMENFSDFTIFYADNSHVGWLSNSTKDILPKESYELLSSFISNENTNDGWFDGYNDFYDHFYYVKRVNKNAVLLVSFYSRELDNAFDIPEELENMNLRLINENNNILYSSSKEEIGEELSLSGYNLSEGFAGTKFVGDELISVFYCENGWRVVCQMSMANALKDVQHLRLFTYIIGCIIIVFFGMMMVVGLKRMSNPLGKTISNLNNRAETDGLSGLLNKVTFEDKVSKTLNGRKNIAFVMIDVDHFKSVNDTKGHAYGDAVIVRMSEVLKKSLREDTIIGRLGGDEFAFVFSDNDLETDILRGKVISRLDDLKAAFNIEFEKEVAELNLSLSFGAYVEKYAGEDFATIYKRTDSALYFSKENGRNRYTIYDESM